MALASKKHHICSIETQSGRIQNSFFFNYKMNMGFPLLFNSLKINLILLWIGISNFFFFLQLTGTSTLDFISRKAKTMFVLLHPYLFLNLIEESRTPVKYRTLV